MYVGDGIVMCEYDTFYHGCNFLAQQHNYNELCGSTFWVLLHQRLQLLEPDNTHHADEIEASMYNILAAAQVGNRELHYLAYLEGSKDIRWVDRVTCCAATGARLIAMLPQLLYTYRERDIYVNLYADSHATLGGTELAVETGMPCRGEVRVRIVRPVGPVTLRLRIPRWCTAPVTIRGVTARPGSFLVLHDLTEGTMLEYTLPFGFRSTRYTGV